MKLIFALTLLMSTAQAQAMTQEQAVEVSKKRIDGLSSQFQELANNCYIFAEDCGITDNSQEATVKWLSFERQDYAPVIQYSKGAENFLIDGAVRVAKTGSSWGSPVVFNEDLLFHEKSPGNFEALDFYEVIGILVHEYGHHQEMELRNLSLRVLEHQELDELAVKVVNYLKDRTRRMQISKDEVPNLAPEGALEILQIEVEWYNGVRNIWSRIFINSASGIQEISKGLTKGIRCPKEYDHGHLAFDGFAAYASFRKVKSPKIQSLAYNVLLEQEIGEASVMCIDLQAQVFQVFNGYQNGKLQMSFHLNEKNGLEYDSGTVQFAIQPEDQGH